MESNLCPQQKQLSEFEEIKKRYPYDDIIIAHPNQLFSTRIMVTRYKDIILRLQYVPGYPSVSLVVNLQSPTLNPTVLEKIRKNM